MAKRRPSLSTVVAFMSDEARERIEDQGEAPATTLPLAAIRPDPAQPRRLLPSDLAQRVAEGALTPADAIGEWMRRVDEAEAGTALTHNALELRKLAMSIEQHGLINPITVRRPPPGMLLPGGVSYLVVTGERRYWAHVLLASEGRQIHEGEQVRPATQVKATLMAEGVSVRAHQLIENLMREDINAVEKARGLWALREELTEVNHGSPTVNDDEAGDEVNHGSPPTGRLVPWRLIDEALGISKRYRIFVTSVLNLCDEAQQLVVDYNLTERAIRPIVQKLKEHPALQVEALAQVVTWQGENESDDGPGRPMVASVQQLVDELLARESSQSAAPTTLEEPAPQAAVLSRQLHGKVRSTLRLLSRLEAADLAAVTMDDAVVQDLYTLREHIDALLMTAPEAGPPPGGRSGRKGSGD